MVAALILSGIATTAPSVSAAGAPTVPTGWHTFGDPVYHFTISYPSSWTLAPGYDGSHITLFHTQTSTTFSPLVSVDTRTPTMVIAQTMAAEGGPSHSVAHTIDGWPVADLFTPYTAPTHTLPHDAADPQTARRTITLAARNRAGTTNVYTFLADMVTDSSGHMSAEVTADDSTISTILSTFRLPSPIVAAPVAQIGSNGIRPDIGGTCNSVCWADANFNYNKYDDSSALYCSQSDSYTGSYGSYSCGGGHNYYAVQAPGGTSQSNPGYYQPYFQCSEFVSRALSQNQDIPGLANGGVNGSLPPTPTVGSYSYGNFPFTYMGGSYSGDSIYYLTDTGTRSGSSGIAGLYEYLTDSGLGYSLGQSLSSARPGDIVFFYQGSVTPANREGQVRSCL